MIYRLIQLFLAPFRPVGALWRLAGARNGGAVVGKGVVVGRGVKIVGNVVLGDQVVLQDYCTICGNVTVGSHAVVQKHAEIAGNVTLGEGTTVAAYAVISTMPTAELTIGNHVLINSFNIIGAGEKVSIGDDCIFAANVQITDSTHSYVDATDSPRHGPASSSPVSIGKGTWLGSGVKVLMGVAIGEGCVVGAGAVVTRSLPAMSICAGMPAKVLRMRNGPADFASEGHS